MYQSSDNIRKPTVWEEETEERRIIIGCRQKRALFSSTADRTTTNKTTIFAVPQILQDFQ
jgi:hypothetical protein